MNDSTTPVLSPQQLRSYRAEGAIKLGPVITDKEITRLAPSAEIQRVCRERRRLIHRISPRGVYTPTAAPPVYERGLAIRIDKRPLSGQVLYTYGAHG